MLNPSRKGGAKASLFKPTGQTFGAGFYLLLSVLIMVSGMVDVRSVNQARRFVGDMVAPVIEALGAPIDWTLGTVTWFDHVVSVYRENERLRQDVKHLRDWQRRAGELALENRRLHEVLGTVELNVPTLVAARVIGVAGGPYVRSVLINAGREHGVREGLPVIDEKGVVGRTILEGSRSSRVLLISDLNSRVPVRVERTNDNAIVVGGNEYLMNLMFLPVGASVEPGDRLLTSGHGRAFPPDLPVGRVISVEGDTILVEPLAEVESLDYVQILDFDASLLEPQVEARPDSTGMPNTEGGR